ncbi:hypothetical protein PSPO_a1874 [Pseudoalteromonas spongiae UST010723-006]|nr:hypothetical protein PSPO_a1874 [Pseudoalteromonas spongiae UST010723-006]
MAITKLIGDLGLSTLKCARSGEMPVIGGFLLLIVSIPDRLVF